MQQLTTMQTKREQDLIDRLTKEFNTSIPTLEQIAERFFGIKNSAVARQKLKKFDFVYQMPGSRDAPYLVNLAGFSAYCIENNIPV